MKQIEKYILSQVSEKQLSKQQAKAMLQELKTKRPNEESAGKPLAIVGISCKLPGIKNPDQFWERLCHEENMVGMFPKSRIQDIAALNQADPFRVGGYVDDIAGFDPAFFRISAKEAELMDPSQRLFLQSAWEALEDAGIHPRNQSMGVFVGMESTDYPEYSRLITENNPLVQTGASTGILASRISYILDLHGPSMVIDCACSSSLVALHTACQYIRSGECDSALVGGVSLFLNPAGEGVVDSAGGQIRTFDKDADGTVWSEGIASVCVMTLEEALKKNHFIYSVIKGSAVNNDGASNGITAPSAEAQAQLLLRAWEVAGVSPESISYLEAHGTGTKLGDPIEIKGITQAMRKHTDKQQFCAIGSAKTNIGHSNGASGIVSVIKMALCLINKKLPPSLFFGSPNPYINFVSSPVFVNDQLRDWRTGENPRICGVSSFGFSGTNCHVVLEEAPIREEEGESHHQMHVFPLSAKSLNSLRGTVEKYIAHLTNNPTLRISDICYTASRGRGHFNYRLALVVESVEDLLYSLREFMQRADWGNREGRFYGSFKLVFNKEIKSVGEVTEDEQRILSAEATALLSGRGGNNREPTVMYALCNKYCLGADVDWSLLYHADEAKIVRLPTYAFDSMKFWVPIESQVYPFGRGSKLAIDSSLIGELLAETEDQWIYETSMSVDSHWILSEHRVAGMCIIPGTAYLEMALQAGKRSLRYPVTRMENVQILIPLSVEADENKCVHTLVRREGSNYTFRIASKLNDSLTVESPWSVHAVGELFFDHPNEAISGKHTSTLQTMVQTIRESEPKPIVPENGLIQFGPRWNNIQHVHRMEKEAVVSLQLPEEYWDDIEAFALHPALLDMAASDFNRQDGNFIPLFYKKVAIIGSLPERCISRIVQANPDNQDIRKYDVTICNPEGQLLVAIEGFTTKRVQDQDRKQMGMNRSMPSFYRMEWREEHTLHSPIVMQPDDTTLILKGEGVVSDEAAEAIQKLGGCVITAVLGDRYEENDACNYILPADYEGFDHVVRLVKECKVRRIIYMATIGNAEEIDSLASLRHKQEIGFTGLYRLTKALVNGGIREEIDLVLISDYVHEVTGTESVLMPGGATMLGLGRVICEEHPNIHCRGIDIDHYTDVEQIAREALSGIETPYLVAFREGKKYTEYFDTIEQSASITDEVVIRDEGYYLITGGFGSIGLEIAQYLSERSQAAIVLLSRTIPSRETNEAHTADEVERARKMEILDQFDRLGKTIVYCAADVADEKQMRAVLRNLRSEHGPLRGIVHTAGVAGNGFAVIRDEEEYHEALNAKVYGTWILHELTRQEELDFFVMFSSVTSIIGAAGQGDYTAANGFLDAFEAYRNRICGNTYAINWAAWSEVGMAKRFGGSQDGIFRTLTTQEGLAYFAKSLSLKAGKVIAGTLRPESLSILQSSNSIRVTNEVIASLTHKESVSVTVKSNNLLGWKQTELEGKPDGHYTDTERIVADVWGQALGTSSINVHDNFYALGGDSILALRIVNDITKNCLIKVDIVDLFEYPSVHELAKYLDHKQTSEHQHLVAGDNTNEVLFELSLAQQRIWFLQKFDPEMTAYQLFTNIPIQNEMDVERFKEALNICVKRHDALRTRFVEKDGEPWQYFALDVGEIFEFIDLSDRSNPKESELEMVEQQCSKPMDLFGTLFQVTLFKLEDTSYHLFFNVHHLITDGWSSNLLFNELLNVYDSLRESKLLRLQDPAYQYADWIRVQNQWLNSSEFQESEAYWQQQIAKPLPMLNLPIDYSRPPVKTYNGGYLLHTFDREQTESLKQLAASCNVTPYMLMLSLYGIFLNKISGDSDIIIGCPSAGRTGSDFENVIGLFMNVLCIRIKFSDNQPFKSLVEHVKQQSLQAYKHGRYPFERLVTKVNPDRDVSRSPIFTTMFQYYDHIPQPNERYSQYDLSLLCKDSNGQIEARLEYNSDLFHRGSVIQLVGMFTHLIEEILRDPDVSMRDIRYVPATLMKKLREDFNDTKVAFPNGKTVHQLVHEQALREPDLVAVVNGEQSLTYGELEERSDQLALWLKRNGAGRGDVVALAMGRTTEAVVAILGILKSGAAYLPIDVNYPRDRVEYILEDSGARFIVTQSSLDVSLPEGCIVCNIDTWHGEDADRNGVFTYSSMPNDLAYIIYTSGSTGKPKGVMIEHLSAVNFIYGMTDQIDFLTGKSILALTTVSFDISFLELVLPLTRGMKVVMANEEVQLDPKLLADEIGKHGVDMLQMTPSRMTLLLRSGHTACLKQISEILIGGEPFPEIVLTQLKTLTAAKIYNMYGPTETTIWSTMKELTESSAISIGKPISNTSIYILSEDGQLLPPGFVGELCIGGTGVARGYRNKPELTEMKFVNNPFEPGTKLYKTGDLAKWSINGELQHLGRNDNQVKIRGYRIEIGEIESALLEVTSIREAAVVTRRDRSGHTFLCAYIVSDENLGAPQVRQELAKGLPEYMIPSKFVSLDCLPMTPNGKIDRKALLSEVLKHDEPTPSALSETESKLMSIWRSVLDLDAVAPDANFFEHGGHSLNAGMMIARVNKEFHVDMRLSELFQNPTVQRLAKVIENEHQVASRSIERSGDMPYYPLTSGQKRLYVLHHLEPNSVSYNIPAVFSIRGPLEPGRIVSAFGKLMERHSVLRTSFGIRNGTVVQLIGSDVLPDVEVSMMEKDEISRAISEFIQPFDIGNAPLFRMKVGIIDDRNAFVLFDMHHLIADGLSVAIMMKELFRLYHQEEVTNSVIQYSDYSVWQANWMKSEAFRKQERYWLSRFERPVPMMNLPADYPRPSVQSFEGNTINFHVDARSTERLKRLAEEQGATLFMTLLALYYVLLHNHSSEEDIIIGTPVSGRTLSEIESTVGVFINMLPLRHTVRKEMLFIDFLNEIRLNTVEALENQSYPFEMLIERLHLERDLSRNPIFDTVFAMQQKSQSEYQIGNLQISPVEPKVNVSKFDLTLQVTEIDSELSVELQYCTRLFSEDTIRNIGEDYIRMIKRLLDHPNATLSEIGGPSRVETSRPHPKLPVIRHREQATENLMASGLSHVPPITAIQEDVTAVCKEVLGLQKLGVSENLFHIGGDSFLIVQIQLQLDGKYPDLIRVADLFAHPTVAEISRFIQQGLAQADAELDSQEEEPLVSDITLSEVNWDRLVQPAARNGLSVQELLLSIFIYSYAEFATEDKVIVLAGLHPNQSPIPIELDLSDMTSQEELFVRVRNSCMNPVQMAAFAHESNNRIPYFSTASHWGDAGVNKFIHFHVDVDGESARIKYRYRDSSPMTENPEGLLYAFINILNFMLQHDANGMHKE